MIPNEVPSEEELFDENMSTNAKKIIRIIVI